VLIAWSIDFASPDPHVRTAEIRDARALDRTLNAIACDASEPLIVELISPDGSRMGLGLATSSGVLTFQESADPPYFMSAGDIGLPDEDVGFYLHGHWTEFPGTALVANEDAREAARRFLATGDRPANVMWEEV
jgi:Immunity protein Imm1